VRGYTIKRHHPPTPMRGNEAISRMKTEELDRLVAAGTIREIDREYVRLTVHRIVYPPERPDDMCLSQTR
jgi:hypothetical protein